VALAAVLGIVLAAAITWGTSQLVRQRIGLASEPLTVGRRLLPPVASTPARTTRSPSRRPSTTSSHTRSTPPPATVTTIPPAPVTTTSSSPPVARSAPAEPVETAPPAARGSEGDHRDASSHRDD
jgi:hypothetical protein